MPQLYAVFTLCLWILDFFPSQCFWILDFLSGLPTQKLKPLPGKSPSDSCPSRKKLRLHFDYWTRFFEYRGRDKVANLSRAKDHETAAEGERSRVARAQKSLFSLEDCRVKRVEEGSITFSVKNRATGNDERSDSECSTHSGGAVRGCHQNADVNDPDYEYDPEADSRSEFDSAKSRTSAPIDKNIGKAVKIERNIKEHGKENRMQLPDDVTDCEMCFRAFVSRLLKHDVMQREKKRLRREKVHRSFRLLAYKSLASEARALADEHEKQKQDARKQLISVNRVAFWYIFMLVSTLILSLLAMYYYWQWLRHPRAIVVSTSQDHLAWFKSTLDAHRSLERSSLSEIPWVWNVGAVSLGEPRPWTDVLLLNCMPLVFWNTRLFLVESMARWHRSPFSHYDTFVDGLRGLRVPSTSIVLYNVVPSTSIVLYNVTCSSLIKATNTYSGDLEAECANNPTAALKRFARQNVNPFLSIISERTTRVAISKECGTGTHCLFASIEELLLERKEVRGSWLVGLPSKAKQGEGDYAGVQESSAATKDKTFSSSFDIDELKRLVDVFPRDPFENPKQRSWVKHKFPMFHFTVIGSEGAGKSTTLRWLANHLQLPKSRSYQFLSAKGGQSYTRQLKGAKLADGLKVFDTKGLPSLEERYVPNVKLLLRGHWQEHCEIRWESGETSAWSSMTVKGFLAWVLWIASHFCNFIKIIMLVILCAIILNLKFKFLRQSVVGWLCFAFVLLLALLLIFETARGSLGHTEADATCQRLSEASPRTASHATLFIVRYIDEDQDEDGKQIQRVSRMLNALRDGGIDPVIGVTHIGNCSGEEERKAEVFAAAIGSSPLLTFPLCAMPSADGSDAHIYVPPGMYLPIIQALQACAHQHYAEAWDRIGSHDPAVQDSTQAPDHSDSHDPAGHGSTQLWQHLWVATVFLVIHFGRRAWSALQQMQRTTGSQPEDLQQEQEPEAPLKKCNVCDESSESGIACSQDTGPDHFTCAECFRSHARAWLDAVVTGGEDSAAQAGHVARHRGNGGMLQCIHRDPLCSCFYGERDVALCLGDDEFARYIRGREQVMAHHCREELVARQQRGQTEEAQTREYLRSVYPDALQCPRCGHGPVIVDGCSDLRAHHGQRAQGGGTFSNACHACGFFSNERAQWMHWDGRLR